MQEIDLSAINDLPDKYPDELIEFAKTNLIKLPSITSGNGKALVVMINNPNYYFTRKTTDEFVKKFNINSSDSIQLFNKHEQYGLKQNGEKNKYYIKYPYEISTKSKIRKNFKYSGSEEDKNIEINNIKNNIQQDYIDIDNKHWQLGHKNPELIDENNKNLVLQPPIQSKYRDDYIFIDTITKFPLAKKLYNLWKKKVIQFTINQIDSYIEYLTKIKENLESNK